MSKANLKDARRAKGLSQKDLADLLGISQVYVSAMELGKESPSDEVRKRLKEVLGEVSYLRDIGPGNEVRKIVAVGNTKIPFYRSMVHAGKQGVTVEDWQEEFDIAEHYENTSAYEVSGDSMIKAGIEEGDRVIVKNGYRFKNKDVILCRFNGELMIKGVAIINEEIWLFPANDKHHPWKCRESDEFQCIGRVIEIIKQPHREWWEHYDFNRLR